MPPCGVQHHETRLENMGDGKCGSRSLSSFAYLCREGSCFYPGRSASLSFLTGVEEPSLRGFVLTWQKSAEDENPGGIPGKGLKAVCLGDARELWSLANPVRGIGDQARHGTISQ